MLPRTSRQQWYAGAHPDPAALAPGDLVFYATDVHDPATIHHVGIYASNGFMIDAPHTGAQVRFSRVDRSQVIGAVRL